MKKFLLFVCAVLCLCTVLAGCGQPYNQNDPNTLVVWGTVINTDYEKTLASRPNDKVALYSKAVLEKFHEKYPEVKVEVYDMGWAESLNQQFMNSAKANTLPDVFIGETYIRAYAEEQLLKPIEIDPVLLADIYENMYEPFSIDGAHYGIPLYTGTFGLVYNKNILAEAGLPEPELVPETWDDLLKNCQTVANFFKSSSGKNDIGGMLLSCTGSLNAAFYALPFLRQKDTNCVDDQGNLIFNDPKAAEAYAFIRELAETIPYHSEGLAEDALDNIFLNERAAYRLAGPWFFDELDEDQISHYGACELPIPEGGVEGNVIVGNVVASLTRQCDNDAAGTAFIETFLDPEVQSMLLDTYSRLPVRRSINGDASLYADKPYIEAYITGLEAENNTGGLPSFSLNSTRIWDSWLSTFYNIVMTKSDIPTLLDGLQEKTEGLV